MLNKDHLAPLNLEECAFQRITEFNHLFCHLSSSPSMFRHESHVGLGSKTSKIEKRRAPMGFMRSLNSEDFESFHGHRYGHERTLPRNCHLHSR